jgi:hypothetical protein
VTYAKAFFDLQLEFAHRVTVLSGLALPRALMEYTNLYIRFGLGHTFDASHPVWQEYVAGLQDTNDHRGWTYRFYLTRSPVVVPPDLVATFGCFSYSRSSHDRIRLHFENAETDGRAPLANERRDQRLEDLTALFAHVKRTVPEPLQVLGASWLYNLGAYRRLFPVSYIASARIVHDRFQHMPLWGQFLNRSGQTRESMTHEFRERLGRQSSLEGLEQCFPFQVLRVEASVLEFYEFYGCTPR